MADVHHSVSYPGNFVRYLDNGKHSDFDIECSGHVFKVHKIVLGGASGWFERLFANDWKETKENRIVLHETKACLVARLLLFLYTGSDDCQNFEDAATSVQFRGICDDYKDAIESWFLDAKLAIYMYCLACYYDIEALRVLARSTFYQAFYDERVPQNTQKAENIRTVLSGDDDFARQMQELISLIYEHTHDGDWRLRDIVIEYAQAEIESENALASQVFHDTLRDIPAFAFDIATTKLSNTERECSNCGDFQLQLSWRCKCGCVENCRDAKCCALRTKRSICSGCSKFGTVQFTPLPAGEVKTGTSAVSEQE